MNVGTIVVLLIVAGVVALAIRSIVRKKGSHCDGCSGCSHAQIDASACSCDADATYEKFKAAVEAK